MVGKSIAVMTALLLSGTVAAHGQAADSAQAQGIELSAALAAAAAGATAAIGGYYLAPTIVRAIGLGETTKDVRAAGGVIASAVLIPLAYRYAAERPLSERAMVVSALLGMTGAALALGANENDGIQRGVIVVVPVAQLLATLALK